MWNSLTLLQQPCSLVTLLLLLQLQWQKVLHGGQQKFIISAKSKETKDLNESFKEGSFIPCFKFMYQSLAFKEKTHFQTPLASQKICISVEDVKKHLLLLFTPFHWHQFANATPVNTLLL